MYSFYYLMLIYSYVSFLQDISECQDSKTGKYPSPFQNVLERKTSPVAKDDTRTAGCPEISQQWQYRISIPREFQLFLKTALQKPKHLINIILKRKTAL